MHCDKKPVTSSYMMLMKDHAKADERCVLSAVHLGLREGASAQLDVRSEGGEHVEQSDGLAHLQAGARGDAR